MSNYESGMGSGRGTDDTAAPDDGMRASRGLQIGATEQGMGTSQGYSTGAPEQGMGAAEGGPYENRTDEYGMGSGRASDEKEGKVGKMFDKIKERLTKPHEENK